jgi:primosomal protein N' (replication factor Y)
MYYYEVAPAYRQLHSNLPLTYQSEKIIQSGAIVVVKIRNVVVVGIVIKQVPAPKFATQSIIEITLLHLEKYHFDLLLWLMDYYPASIGSLAQLFVPNTLKDPSTNDNVQNPTLLDLPPLTIQQKEVLETIERSVSRTFLLHGDTATGKSRVYIELTRKALKANKSALILTPEISLTPQLVENFEKSLGRSILVTHSNLTTAQKRKLWLQIARAKEPVVVVGPRSALFMPIKNLGLIVIDEAHETAYKQEQQPRYQTSRVASKLAELSKAQLIFGSATPLISDYYIASQKNIPILRMTEKPLAQKNNTGPVIKMVNLTDKTERSAYSLLSNSLLTEIQKALKAGEQSLIFLNRRGSARVILCQTCAWQAHCPRCDLPYTYHSDAHILRCHTCGRTDSAPSICPTCGSSDIIFKSPGTKTIADNLSRIFPDAVIARFDKDNLKSEKFEARFHELQTGGIDIMVGTQLVAKGHDLPRLSCVGILVADSELTFPDFSSEERSYQLVKQLIGRVGRGHRSGSVVIQTYDENNAAIKAASGGMDWVDFYHQQLQVRKKFGFPPFAHFLKIEVSRTTKKGTEKAAEKIAFFLREKNIPLQVLGPHPSFIEKRAGKWVWQIIVSSKQRSVLVDLTRELPLQCSYDLDPSNLL